MKAWLTAQWQHEQQNQAYVLVSIVALQGSSPRGVGSKILVTKSLIERKGSKKTGGYFVK